MVVVPPDFLLSLLISKVSKLNLCTWVYWGKGGTRMKPGGEIVHIGAEKLVVSSPNLVFCDPADTCVAAT